MLDEPHLSVSLTEIAEFARSGPSLDELLSFFTPRALSLLDCREIEVRPGTAGQCAPDSPPGRTGVHVSCFPIWRGRTPWGELHLTYVDPQLAIGELHRARLIAEVLGAALLSVWADVGAAPHGEHGDSAAVSGEAGFPDQDEMAAVVLDCAEALDEMPDASTRARLVTVLTRLAAVVGATSWSVGLTDHGRLYDVSDAGAQDRVGGRIGTAAGPAGPVWLSGFPARRRASEGGAFYADACTGDDAERRALAENGHSAVVGAGGYDLDGRSWVVELFADSTARFQYVTPVLEALILAALSFPREASVPRPEEPWVRATIRGMGVAGSPTDVRGFGAAG